jgi:hypothetical protein
MQMKDKIEGLACDAIHLRDLIKLVMAQARAK